MDLNPETYSYAVLTAFSLGMFNGDCRHDSRVVDRLFWHFAVCAA